MQKLIGHWTAGNKPAHIDLDLLVTSRMMVCANSGGGKSYMLRVLLETMAGSVQQIMIDTDGEFASLREKYDFVICAARGGDAIAHPKTAALLARRLMETKVSAVVDISDLKVPERHEFVRRFISELMVLPRTLWNPMLLYLDEAHIYCPERGFGESEAADSVIDLASRGRKRGYCLIAATQRIAKFRKDAAAELLNRLTGRTGFDIDVKRAAFDLGMAPKDAQAILPHLEPGHFFAYGPAISKTVEEMRSVPVRTTHPKPGTPRAVELPKPTRAIMQVLPQLADLPKEVEAQERTVKDLEATIRQQQQEIRALKNDLGKAAPAVDTEAVKREHARVKLIERALVRLGKALVDLEFGVEEIAVDFDKKRKALHDKIERTKLEIEQMVGQQDLQAAQPAMPRHMPVMPRSPAAPADRGNLPKPQQAILNALAWFADKGICPVAKNPLAAVACASPSSSSYANNLGALRTAGYIEYPSGGYVKLTASGEVNAVLDQPEGLTLFEAWMALPTLSGPQKNILQTLMDVHPQELSKEELAQGANASLTSSSFANNLGALRSLGCIDYPKQGFVALTKNIAP